jgi:predicted membrane-bound mannosyltransferase
VLLALASVVLAASVLMLYSRDTDNTENTVLLLRSAAPGENTGHMITKYCWSVTSLRLLGSVFTELLPRSELHNPVVPLLLEAAVSVAQTFLHGANTLQ